MLAHIFPKDARLNERTIAMKIRSLLLTLLIAIILSCFCTANADEEMTFQDYTFILNENNEAVITGYTGTKQYLFIPEVLDSYSVTAIDDFAFADNQNLIYARIPLTVSKIGINPFKNCQNLYRIYVSPRHETFSTIDGILYRKDNKKLISFPIWSWYGYQLPEGLKTIGAYAFCGDCELETIYLPDSLVKIEASAFENCTVLTDVRFDSNIKEIGESAFKGCKALTTISFPGKLKTISANCMMNCTELVNVTLPANVNTIEGNAFYGCEKLEKIAMPNSITTIGDYAFCKCNSLKQLNLPISLVEIGSHAFEKCSSLETIQLPGALEKLGSSSFAGCSNLLEITMNCKIMSLEDNTFNGCKKLQTIVVPSGVRTIGSRVFSGCEKLDSVSLPDGLKTIGMYAFDGCFKINYIYLPSSVSSIATSAFSNIWAYLVVEKDSYAEKFAINNSEDYFFLDSFDWLTQNNYTDDQIVVFGKFEQDNDPANGKENIEWIVLDEDDGAYLLISKNILTGLPYNMSDTTFASKTLDDWLKNEFCTLAFTGEELSQIIPESISLLSLTDATKYFSSNQERACQATAYAIEKGVSVNDSGNCTWWLSTDGTCVECKMCVLNAGGTLKSGKLTNTVLGVRPALWVTFSD